METKAVTVRVDKFVKEQAEKMLDDIGMNMTTYIVLSLKALVREQKIPFELVTSKYLLDQKILEKWAIHEIEADQSNTERLSYNEVSTKTREELLTSAFASAAMEGYEITAAIKKDCIDIVNGELSISDYIKRRL
ncbi:MAG: type II toxin-antitoxin system RelB/DinJ family antitoxin [Oscillospiraceae bacterium]|nr:type II toxin-antitoxin system RelB/DinJ family antitoxin [Oscillospiraceae bacterium]